MSVLARDAESRQPRALAWATPWAIRSPKLRLAPIRGRSTPTDTSASGATSPIQTSSMTTDLASRFTEGDQKYRCADRYRETEPNPYVNAGPFPSAPISLHTRAVPIIHNSTKQHWPPGVVSSVPLMKTKLIPMDPAQDWPVSFVSRKGKQCPLIDIDFMR